METAGHSQAGLGLALVFDAPDEGWVSMERVGAELERALNALGESTARLQWRLPNLARKASGSQRALNVDRALGRFGLYPARLSAALRAHRLFHVVDHSYSHLAWLLPPGRTGVYCHDLDAYRAVLPGAPAGVEPWRRAMTRLQWEGLRRAAVVFCSTAVTADQLHAHGFPRERLVVAPYGTGPEFTPEGPEVPEVSRLLSGLGGHPFLLHVGSGAPRKRLDRLMRIHARLRAEFPGLWLVQHGAPAEAFPARPDGLLRTAGPLSPAGISQLYREAAAVLQPSDAEGFGLPVLEALACGAPVVASDLPTLREVGRGQVIFVPGDDVEAWARAVAPHLAARPSAAERAGRRTHAARFSWEAQARAVRAAYAGLAARTWEVAA